MEEQVKYVLVKGSPEFVADEVNRLLGEGWLLYGFPTVAYEAVGSTQFIVIIQSMTYDKGTN